MMKCCACVTGLQREIVRILGITSLCIVIPGALAAGYPDRLVRLIVPALPGSATDTTMRLIAPKLAEHLGQQTVVVENRAGVSGNIGAELAARAAPDGYTLLAVYASHTSNVAVMKNVPFDMVRDFAPISLAVILPSVLVSHPSLPQASHQRRRRACAERFCGRIRRVNQGRNREVGEGRQGCRHTAGVKTGRSNT